MSEPQPFVLRWGILGCGKISSVFVKDLLLDPSTRGVSDVVHKVVAIGSRDVTKSKEWTDEHTGAGSGVKAYGTYEEVVADKDVDAVYIGTPHTFHYTGTALALRAGKHVLCEKPFTSNAAELRSLIVIAKEKGVFLMEAMWTRFQPVAIEVSKIIQSKTLGDIRFVHADLAGDFDIENIPTSHRILSPELGGGALLDLGPYPLVWAIIALYEHPENNSTPPAKITGTMLKTPLTNVDSSTVFVLNFETLHAQAILSCSITIPPPSPSVTIRFRSGNILLFGPPYKPTSLTVQYLANPGSDKVVKEDKKGPAELGFEGGGWHFQADDVARNIRDGKKESSVWGLDKSLLEMDIFDEVRKQGGYVFPKGVEQVV